MDRQPITINELEFEDMVRDLRKASLHSSAIASPATKNHGLHMGRALSLDSPKSFDLSSPSQSPLKISPRLRNKTYMLESGKSKTGNPTTSKVTFDLSACFGESIQSTDDWTGDSIEFDLNSTYSLKTMSTQQSSAMLEALQESPSALATKTTTNSKPSTEVSFDLGIWSDYTEDRSADSIEKDKSEGSSPNNIEINLNSTYSDKMMSPQQLSVMREALEVNEEDSPLFSPAILSKSSPYTPLNGVKPPYNRDFRLGNEPFRRI